MNHKINEVNETLLERKMSVFHAVNVFGMEFAVASSLGCTHAAVDRDGSVYAYKDYPGANRRTGQWFSAYPRVLLCVIHDMKRGRWLHSRSIVLDNFKQGSLI